MVFFKLVEVKDAQEKYGFSHQGVFAKERIRKHEAIFTCDLAICDYLKIEHVASGKTREETLRLFAKYPDQKDFMHKYSYMIDDDKYDWPRDWMEQKLHENCMFFNHSCDPNCGFQVIILGQCYVSVKNQEENKAIIQPKILEISIFQFLVTF